MAGLLLHFRAAVYFRDIFSAIATSAAKSGASPPRGVLWQRKLHDMGFAGY
jgi:hypothetical protein